MKAHSDDFDLTVELRALRPTPRAEFAAELDARVDAEFAQRSEPSGSLPKRVTDRLRATSPRRALVPAAATALLAVVVATALVATQGPVSNKTVERLADTSESAGGSGRQFGTQHSDTPPAIIRNDAAKAASGTGRASSGAEFHSFRRTRLSAQPFGARHRDVERAAELVFRDEPDQIAADAKEVFAATHTAHGIVLSSSIHDRAASRATTASFDLLIPTLRLSDALASLSRIADVSARHESTLDITAPTVGVDERLDDSEARIDGLLVQLSSAASDGERAAVEAELRRERQAAAALRSHLDRLRQRANFSRVSLRIESGHADEGAGTGQWGVGDALDDAGRILTIAAGVLVVGLALVGPLALIAFLAWLANRSRLRRSRERALA